MGETVIRKLRANPVKIENPTEENKVGKQRENSSGWTQRPHMRRAHWHHFWTGKKGEERKLILKWIAPSFINTELGEQPATINIVS